ncbi:MAG: hypothetical protein QXL77_08055 [Candidatus Bathyarchaeia archaeon]
MKRVSDLASADGAPWRCDVSDDGVHRLHREERWSLKALQAMSTMLKQRSSVPTWVLAQNSVICEVNYGSSSIYSNSFLTKHAEKNRALKNFSNGTTCS